jgi:hypothetical protein
METLTERGVAIPPELTKFPEAEALYPKLLLRAKPDRLRQFGIDDLAFRLECQTERERRKGIGPDETAHARIWYLVAAKCSEGSSDVSSPAKDALREWMPDAETSVTKTVGASCVNCGKKMRQLASSTFVSCRDCRGARNRRETAIKHVAKTGALPEGWKTCAVCADPFLPGRSDAMYCPKPSCRQRASRERREEAKQQNRDRQAQVLAELA